MVQNPFTENLPGVRENISKTGGSVNNISALFAPLEKSYTSDNKANYD